MTLHTLRKADDGASAVEYGLIVFAIAALITLIVFALGGAVKGMFTSSCTTISSKVDNGATDCTG